MMPQRLTASELRRCVDPVSLGFADTRALQHLPLPWIGQERAEQAARFGMGMDAPDYNLFVLGEVGSGRTTLLTQLMHTQAALRPVPPDLCYLHNFEVPERPHALRLPAGQGRLLRQQMDQLTKRLHKEIPKRLAQDDFKAEAKRIESACKAEEDRGYLALSAYAQAHHFALMRDEGHMVFTLRDDQGEPVTAGKAMALSPAQRADIDAAEDALRGEISRHLDNVRALERVRNEGLTALRRQTLIPWLEHELQQIRQTFHSAPSDAPDAAVRMGVFLAQVQHSVLDQLALFEPTEDDEDTRLPALMQLLSLLGVNVAVDNHALQGAPVIVEDNPVFRSLFGSIEYVSDGNELSTDFSHIRAGSLLKAHGVF